MSGRTCTVCAHALTVGSQLGMDPGPPVGAAAVPVPRLGLAGIVTGTAARHA